MPVHADRAATASPLSREFAARLDRLRPDDRVRAIIVIATAAATTAAGRGRNAETRKAAVETVKRAAELAVAEIDAILETHQGRRLSRQVSALASVVVETTPEGIVALAGLDKVKAVLEDQEISLLSRARR